MSLLRLTHQNSLIRLLLVAGLICALLIAQLGLTRHTIEHTTKSGVVVTALSDTQSQTPEKVSCLTCLEDQAHSAVLISQAVVDDSQRVHCLERQALAPNTPYLAPERASQRAPPVLS